MPDLTGLTTLDVAIGLAFLFFLLSTICATINEMIAGWLGWRAQELEKALKSHLVADVADFYKKPRIEALIDPARNKDGKRRSPSYIPASAFALAALDTFNPDLPRKAGATAPSTNALLEAREAADKLPPAIRQAVLDALDDGRASIDEIRKDVERTFDQVMDRCAGWYKRRTQRFLLLFAVVLTLGLNIDTFHVADRLAKDDALRAAVVQRATTATAGDTPKSVAKQIDDVKRLGIPLGWAKANQPSTFWAGVGKLFGFIATVLAISLGAPFWFDVLGKFARLRNTGNREGTMKDDERAAEDRDDPSGSRPTVAVPSPS